MPPKKQQNAGGGGKAKARRPRSYGERDSEEYKEKRERNNVAVKKSREKSRQKSKETQEKVSGLRAENKLLEDRVEVLQQELNVLKDLFMAHSGTASTAPATANLETVNKDHGYTASTPPSS
ncbi:CCAAT/enhancer-binding protein gamma isoform X2 [Lingula anatina]|nr:CCAAT/enhancer-binding protein gamma isoform X2 [Lingula anatina]|eukprot:XP_013391037.1 CCAAT/enhancer-binding protein gamma isoform X2 [Lingula anatina]